ncbi:MAG: hypothetical protein JNM88_17245 [Chitinophagaceae bacterium]|nr:hypothetical protein [Chitinophagaceae bacterium]
MIEAIGILECLFAEHTKSSSAENLNDYTFKANVKGIKPNAEGNLGKYLGGFTHKDFFNLTLVTSEGQFTYQGGKNNSIFYQKLQETRIDPDLVDQLSIVLIIQKEAHDRNAYFVYEPATLFQELIGLKNVQLIQAISELFNQNESYLYFINSNTDLLYETRTIFAASSIEAKKQRETGDLDRAKIWERLKTVCHVSGINNCLALPEDFDLINEGGIPDTLKVKFSECKFMLALAVIFDLTEISNDAVKLKLSGYKVFELERSLTPMDTAELSNYYNIYNWIIAGGSIQDKTGLARNLISLNLGDGPSYPLSPSAYKSILSGYKVYERQNIKQYIELRNKMSDQIISFNEKATKIVDGFAGSFQKSTLAVVSLYATLIIGKVLSSSNVIGAFSLGATILSYVFLIISLVYFFMSRKEVHGDKKRLCDAYIRMKARNEDLLEKEDIKLILSDDADHKADLAYMDEKVKWFTTLWVILLSLFAVVTMILYVINVNS